MTDTNETDLSPAVADMMAGLFGSRRSCRAFQDRPVDRSTIERIVEMSQRSPSWCNTQPWQLHITEGEGTERVRAAIREFATSNPPRPEIAFPPGYRGVYDERRRSCAWQLYESVGIEHGDRAASAAQTAKNFTLFDAPHVAIITTEVELGSYGVLDCGVYLAHFLMAAESLGVATVPQAALAAVAPALREQLQLGNNRQVVCGVSFGYADDTHPANGFRTTRADVEGVVTWVR